MKTKKLILLLVCCSIGSIGIVVGLYTISENRIHRHNNFTRRFPHQPAKKIHERNLMHNSYYIAGCANGNIYLGNTTAPQQLLILDSALQKKKTIRIHIDQDSLPFRSVRLSVAPPYFFMVDGTIPFICKGKTTDWIAHSILDEPYYFSLAQPIDTSTLIVRAVSTKNHTNVLGKITFSPSNALSLSYNLLQKQVDGIFDTDGILQYNRQLHQVIYTYFYRNQYVVADDRLNLKFLGKTIDTVSQAQMKVVTLTSENQNRLAAPALLVNRYSATYGNYLFVNSQMVGRYESLKMWKQASVIDVYDLVENTYRFSFYIYDRHQHKLKRFKIINDYFIGMIGNYIVVYKLDQNRFKSLVGHDNILSRSKKILQ